MNQTLQSLIAYLLVIAVLSIGGSYVAYRRRLIRRLPSLRWALLVTVALVVLLIFVNVWVSARLMFISEYDLEVTGILLLFAGLVAIIFGFFVSRALTEGIQELVRAAELVARGKLDTRLTVEGSDELAEFARTFNWMTQSLAQMEDQKQQLEQGRRDLIAWASHDLRTPVTSIRAMIEALADGVVDDPATTARYARDMKLEVENLTRLIDNLFELAQLDAGHIRLDFQETSLRDMISDTLSGMNARAAQQNIALSGEVADSVDVIRVAPDKIQRVLNNLLDNALRYTPSGGAITIRVLREGDSVRVSVHNQGQGMRDFDVANAFTRFYRSEASRSQSQDGRRGAGLGLAITRGFVEAHGGTIKAESLPGEGVTFTFTLPLKTTS